jgi:hypothetical protein
MANALNDERHRGNGFTFLRLVLALIVLSTRTRSRFGSVPRARFETIGPTERWGNLRDRGRCLLRDQRLLGLAQHDSECGSVVLPGQAWPAAAACFGRGDGAIRAVGCRHFTTLGPHAEYWSASTGLVLPVTNPFWMLRGGVHFDLPGVFAPPAHTLRPMSPLWTIPYEIFFYLLLLLPFVLSRASRIGADPAHGDWCTSLHRSW